MPILLGNITRSSLDISLASRFVTVVKLCSLQAKINFPQEYSTAEKLYSACGMYKEAVDMYNEAGQWEKAHAIASKYLDNEEVSDMYLKHAEVLEEAGKYREAEKLYLQVDSPDLAIAMYKRVEQYDNMVSYRQRKTVMFIFSTTR